MFYGVKLCGSTTDMQPGVESGGSREAALNYLHEKLKQRGNEQTIAKLDKNHQARISDLDLEPTTASSRKDQHMISNRSFMPGRHILKTE